VVLDIDQNGVDDFVVGSRKSGPSLVGYLSIGCGWKRIAIENETLPIEAGGAVYDIDGDGDPDLVFGGDYQSEHVWWWENPFPDITPSRNWTRHDIKTTGARQHHDQIIADFDGDGRVELVFWNQGAKSLFWAPLPDKPKTKNSWEYSKIYTFFDKAEGLAAADIDLDGRIDLIGGGCWFKYTERHNFKSNTIDEKQAFARVAAGQLKEGGRPEVVFVVGDGIGRLLWYEWSPRGWKGHDLLKEDVDHGHSLQIADVNGDGHLDILCGEMRLNSKNADAKLWLFYGDGKGNFQKTVIAEGFGVHEAKLADIDGDGNLDIVGKPYNWETPRMDIWLNQTGMQSLDRWKRHVIDPAKPWRAIFVETADLDGDGRPDIVTGGWWYQNPGKPDLKWERRPIGEPLHNMAAVHDFDRDGDADILGTRGEGSEPDASFVWAQNDGKGRFSIHQNIAEGQGDFLQGVTIGSFQTADDREEVLLSWHASHKGLQMLEVPEQPEKEQWPWRHLTDVSQDEALSKGDIDGDGDLDVLLGTLWLRNDQTSWQPVSLTSSKGPPDRNRLADMDGDGRLDAVVGYEINKLAWYRQEVSAEKEWTEHIIFEDIVRPMSIGVADMDGDLDLDIVAGEHNLDDVKASRLMVFENADGRGNCWIKHLVYEGDEHHDGAVLSDLDGDGDMDIVSIGWSHDSVLVYENMAKGQSKQ
jgi:hypothetical protein